MSDFYPHNTYWNIWDKPVFKEEKVGNILFFARNWLKRIQKLVTRWGLLITKCRAHVFYHLQFFRRKGF